jgi:hypothetical protein
MFETRRQVDACDPAELVRATFGSTREIASLEQLRGGSKKGVHQLGLGDGSTSVVYAWTAEDYWAPDGGPASGQRTNGRDGDALRIMHAYRRDRYGRPVSPGAGASESIATWCCGARSSI